MSQLPETQFDIWNGPSGERWVNHQLRLDRFFEPIDRHAQHLAAAQRDEHVIDVGCGCGGSTLRLAERVGPGGAVLGVDISKPMLARARARATDLPWVQFREGDAAVERFARETDLLYSRFGVMFFDQPAQAFANLRSALRPSGRLCFVCWRELPMNPWFEVPLRAASEAVALPALPPPEAPGPFSLASATRIRDILTDAGFTQVDIEPFAIDLTLSDAGLTDGVDFALLAGPLARLLLGIDARQREAVIEAVTRHLAPYLHGQELVMPAAVWMVRAR